MKNNKVLTEREDLEELAEVERDELEEEAPECLCFPVEVVDKEGVVLVCFPCHMIGQKDQRKCRPMNVRTFNPLIVSKSAPIIALLRVLIFSLRRTLGPLPPDGWVGWEGADDSEGTEEGDNPVGAKG